ncbi:MAG: hypothetical protein HYT83_03715 [Candidatus Levybacteria bacterium]|nr:hypothetical protein [Candidatus Levybacteria bacterium]
MSKTITLNEILSLNPQVDEGLLKKARNLGQELRKLGISSRGYNLVSPFHRRHKPISKAESSDSRSVQVGRSKRK